MNNYTKGENFSFSDKSVEDVLGELKCSYPDIVGDVTKVMTVKNGSKLKNLINAAVQQ